jgi:hypothetical protein
MNKFRKEVKRFLNLRNVLFLLLFLIVSLLWFRYIAGVIIIAIFAPITFLTVRYSKMVPHVSIESNTAMSCFIGYIFGPVFGFVYALSVGGFSYVMNSFISATYLATILLAGISASVMGVLSGFGVSFGYAFFIAILTRTIIGWFLFGFLGTSPFERMTHQVSQFFSNLIIYLPLLNEFFKAVSRFL